jgi:AcrR family transcriptional regulator
MIKASAQRRDQILDAAVETLQKDGFAGATSRAIARAGGFNQALVFYYFGSLDALLLAGLERTSEARLARYRTALEDVSTLEQLLETLAALYEDDRRSGHMTVVSQLIAGSLARPELAPQVLERMRPWLELAEQTIARLLPPIVPPADVAHAAVTFYLGVNLLASLDPNDERLTALFEHARQLVPLLTAATASAGSPDPPSRSTGPASGS